MSNPATASILHHKRLESIREDHLAPNTGSSVLMWKHWKVSLPPERKTVVITNDKCIMVATLIDTQKWRCGTKEFSFQEYPKWAEHPNFSKTSKKVDRVKNDMQHLPGTL